MMRIVALCLILGAAEGMRPRGENNGPTLSQWLSRPGCFNVAIAPLLNSQHSLLGFFDVLRETGHLKNMGGVSGVSASALVGAYAAHDKDGTGYVQRWPGWKTLGKTDPELSDNYQKFIATDLPTSFEQLKKPLALTSTLWNSEYDAKQQRTKNAHPIVHSSGDLHSAIIASSSAMSGPGCPKCTVGFQAKTIDGHYPVTDGAHMDPDGTAGLVALPKCNRLLHLWVIDSEEQLPHPTKSAIPTNPTELVTVEIHQPASATHAYAFKHDNGKTRHSDVEWGQHIHTTMEEGTRRMLERSMEVRPDQTDHFVAQSDMIHRLRGFETETELAYDKKAGFARQMYWKMAGMRSSGKQQIYRSKDVLTPGKTGASLGVH